MEDGLSVIEENRQALESYAHSEKELSDLVAALLRYYDSTGGAGRVPRGLTPRRFTSSCLLRYEAISYTSVKALVMISIRTSELALERHLPHPS